MIPDQKIKGPPRLDDPLDTNVRETLSPETHAVR